MNKKTDNGEIKLMMQAFRLNYTRFEVDSNGVKAKLWITMLQEFDPKVIEQATLQIIATRKNEYGWAPDLATVRLQCINLQSGILDTPGANEAWGHVLAKISDAKGDRQLTDTENIVLKSVAGECALYDLRAGIKNIDWVRRDFIKCYDEAVNRQLIEALTPSSVRQMIGENAPKLPSKSSEEVKSEDSVILTYEEAIKEYGSELNQLKQLWQMSDERK